MPKPFKGVVNVDIRQSVPDWEPFLQPKAPEGAPNVLMIVWDDVGDGSMDSSSAARSRRPRCGASRTRAFAIPISTRPRSARLRAQACSRDAMPRATTWPASPRARPASPGSPRVSRSRTARSRRCSTSKVGNTYAIGKWHLTPADEVDLSAWKARWPLGRGFERYYGFLGGETNQWVPDLVYDNHTIAPPAAPADGYHLSKDLSDKAIEFVRDSKAVAPDKPWYMYYCPGCAHAPHHVFEEWATGMRAASTRAMRRSGRLFSRTRRSSGCCPPIPSCRRSTRTASPT